MAAPLIPIPLQRRPSTAINSAVIFTATATQSRAFSVPTRRRRRRRRRRLGLNREAPTENTAQVFSGIVEFDGLIGDETGTTEGSELGYWDCLTHAP